MTFKQTFKILLIAYFGFVGVLNQTYAQKRENIWVFGTRAGIDFNSGVPIPFTTDIDPGLLTHPRGRSTDVFTNASICDTNGEFLFYTDGTNIYNRDYDTMPNGTYLIPGESLNERKQLASVADQGVLIVPMPDSADKYYIFSITTLNIFTNQSRSEKGDFQGIGRLYYSIVDMKLNNGLGDVIPDRKGILIDSNLQEKIVSIVGDRCNIWVLTCGWDARFRAYEITNSGISLNPVISTVGTGNFSAPGGCITVAPSRRKIAATQSGAVYFDYLPKDENGHFIDFANFSSSAVALYDFDPASGIVSNPLTLMPYFTPSAYASPGDGFALSGLDSCARFACFSPDGSKLYASTHNWFSSLNPNSKLLQFDIISGDSTIMANSRTLIAYVDHSSHIKVAPNGKIYLAGNGNKRELACIMQPNQPGIACQYVSSVITLDSGTSWYMGLPNVISELKRDTAYTTAQSIIVCDNNIQISATDTSGWDYIWDDDSSSFNRSIYQSGTYILQYLTSPCVYHTDTFRVTLLNLPVPIINVNEFELSTTESYDTYQWYLNDNIIQGATDSVYTVAENGDYIVVVGDNESGCTDTSAVYKVNNVAGISLDNLQEEIKIYPNPASDIIYIQSPVAINTSITSIDRKLVKQAGNTTRIDVKDLAEGVYFIHVYDHEGVLLKVTKFIKVK